MQGKQSKQQRRVRSDLGFGFFFFFPRLSRILSWARRREKSLTFCLNGRQEQGRAQGGERWGKPGPHARPRGSQPHEGNCRRKQ